MSPMTLQSLVVSVTEGEERAVDADTNMVKCSPQAWHLIFFLKLRTDADNRLTKSYKLWSHGELKEFTMILHMDEIKI